VIRVRGKSILLLVLILSIAMTNAAFAGDVIGQHNTIVRVQPSVVTALPGEKFWVDITVENVTDLYAFGFKLGYAGGTKVLGALKAVDGVFLMDPYGDPCSLTYYVDVVNGYIHVGATLIGEWPGVSTVAPATLARIQFAVVEAGDSPLNLYDVNLIDSSLKTMISQTRDGEFDGSNVELVSFSLGKRAMKVGETQTFSAKIRNEGTVPLKAKVRFDSMRIEDGWTVTSWDGQSYQFPPKKEDVYLYPNAFTAERTAWTAVGTSPYLNAPDDGSYIEGTTDGAQMRWFEFEDIALEGGVVDKVILEGYTNGPYNEGLDFDTYTGDFDWLGSLYASGALAWVEPRWTGGLCASEIVPALLTEEGLNGFKANVYFYDPGLAGGAGNIVDCIRLKVMFKAGKAPAYPVPNAFTAERNLWTAVGTSPYLNAPDDGSYIEGTTDGAQMRWFEFEDIATEGSVIDKVTLEGYTNGPYNEGLDFDVYDGDFNWLGSLYASGGPAWVTPRWLDPGQVASDIVPALLTEAGVNSFKAMVYFYDPGLAGGAGNIVDCIRLKVEYKTDRTNMPSDATVYEIQPGEVAELVLAYFPLLIVDAGTYVTTATVYFSYTSYIWNTAEHVITRSWHIQK